MSQNIFEKTLKNIREKSADITRKQIISHNRECFKLHFDDGEGRIFIYPHECRGRSEENRNVGYVYEGMYQGPDLVGVKVYESKNVELDKFKDLERLKSPSGKDLFSLDELVEFDYNNTNKIWKWETARISERKNTVKATKLVINDMIRNKKVNS